MASKNIYFCKNDILQIKSELQKIFNAIILIHSNTITIVWDYSRDTINEVTDDTDPDMLNVITKRFMHDIVKQNNNTQNPVNIINNNINNDINDYEPYKDKYHFSFFDHDENNLYNTMDAAEEISLSFSLNDDIINCKCSRIEIDPESIMGDQSAEGSFKFQMQNNTFTYKDGYCEDRYGDCYGISSKKVIDVLNVIHKYWKY